MKRLIPIMLLVYLAWHPMYAQVSEKQTILSPLQLSLTDEHSLDATESYTNISPKEEGVEKNLNAACTCLEAGNVGNLLLCDNFQDYQLGSIHSQSSKWRKASSSPNATVVGNNVEKQLRIARSGSTYTSVLHDFGSVVVPQGRYRLSWRMFIGEAAYYRVEHPTVNIDGGTYANYAYQVLFNPQGYADILLGNVRTVVKTFPYNKNAWNKVVQIIDRNSNTIELWINDDFVHSWDFRVGSENVNSSAVRGVVFGALRANISPAVSNYEFLVDDICLWQKRQPCNTTLNISPVCLKTGKQYDNSSAMQCDLYTPDEQGTCPAPDNTTICDIGGTFVYRDNNISGTLSDSVLAPAQVLRADCVQGLFGEVNPPEIYSDLYVFYNTERKDIGINVNRGAVAIFRCDCYNNTLTVRQNIENSISNCQQTCLQAGSNVYIEDAPIGFYYIAVLNDVPQNYSFSIVPEGTCEGTTTPLICGTPVSSTVTGQTNNYSVDGSATVQAYRNCYSGTRPYSGDDRVFKFELDKPSLVDIQLTANRPMGMFLYDFLCGEKCISYAENSNSGGSAFLNKVSLTAGVYYVIVDKATAGGNGNFTISLNCAADVNYPFFVIAREVECPKDTLIKHEITLLPVAANASLINGTAIKTEDILSFWGPPSINGAMASRPWKTPRVTFTLYADQAGDTLKCGFDTLENFQIRIQKPNSNNWQNLNAEFYPQSPNNSSDSKFKPAGISTIKKLTGSNISFQIAVSPSTLTLPSVPTTSSPLQIASNITWAIKSYPSWITPDRLSGAGDGIVNLQFQPNLTTLPRTDTIFVEGGGKEQRNVIIQQLGCTGPTANAGPDHYIIAKEQATLIGSGSISPNNIYGWINEGYGTSITVRPLATTTYTFIVKDIASGCSSSDEATVFVSQTLQGNVGQLAALLDNMALNKNELVQIFPNPTVGKLTLQVDAADAKEVTIKIYDLMGKILQQVGEGSNPQPQYELDLSDQPLGVYIVKVQIDKNVVSKKIILHK